jgi:hypothetical protein
MGYSGALGKLIHEKPEVENLVALSLEVYDVKSVLQPGRYLETIIDFK